jgi:hypothetical protein
MMYENELNDEVAHRKLRNLLRELGLRSVKSELEYSVFDLMSTINRDMFGKPDQIFVSPQTFAGLKKILSKDKED